ECPRTHREPPLRLRDPVGDQRRRADPAGRGDDGPRGRHGEHVAGAVRRPRRAQGAAPRPSADGRLAHGRAARQLRRPVHGAMLVVTSADNAEKKNKKPLGRIVSWGISGCDPEIMGIGPVPSTKMALDRAKMSLDDIDLIEINEAFAGQILAVVKELGIDKEKLNVNGGAIALGHPLAASGTRLLLTILYELRRRKARYGLASACI